MLISEINFHNYKFQNLHLDINPYGLSFFLECGEEYRKNRVQKFQAIFTIFK